MINRFRLASLMALATTIAFSTMPVDAPRAGQIPTPHYDNGRKSGKYKPRKKKRRLFRG